MKVIQVDLQTGEQSERDMTPEEISELPPPASLAELQAGTWKKIKAERDGRKSAGVKIGDKWFHTDSDSRIQQIGLVLFGASVPPVQWKTMDGSFVPMSQALAVQIFQGVAMLDQALFAKAEQHRIAMEASDDPSSYDFTAGWPLAYGE